MSTIEEQKELFDKYTKRLQVVREIKERQSIEFQGKWQMVNFYSSHICHRFSVSISIV